MKHSFCIQGSLFWVPLTNTFPFQMTLRPDSRARALLEDWGKAMADLVQPVRDGRIADGLVDAIGDVGVLLAQHLPRASDDVNELPDRMIHL